MPPRLEHSDSVCRIARRQPVTTPKKSFQLMSGASATAGAGWAGVGAPSSSGEGAYDRAVFVMKHGFAGAADQISAVQCLRLHTRHNPEGVNLSQQNSRSSLTPSEILQNWLGDVKWARQLDEQPLHAKIFTRNNKEMRCGWFQRPASFRIGAACGGGRGGAGRDGGPWAAIHASHPVSCGESAAPQHMTPQCTPLVCVSSH